MKSGAVDLLATVDWANCTNERSYECVHVSILSYVDAYDREVKFNEKVKPLFDA